MKTKYDSPYDDGEFDNGNLFFDIFRQMLMGAGLAGGVIVGAGLFVYVLYLSGTLLPEESKLALDPTPDSFVSRDR